jgi:uncharacterized protein (TIGR02466 family)|tara:strand:- start:847 stop:1479 length:633 start_codon:yes stop_codon:yes gene_type:complete
MKEIATIPLFAIPLTVYEIEHIDQEKIEKILKSLKYNKIDKFSKHSLIGKDLKILNNVKEFQSLKIKIEQAVNNFSEKIMGNKKTNFALTSSWATKTRPGESSDIHKHSNNMISAVYYNYTHDDMGEIRFFNNNNNTFELDVENYNIFNSTYWNVKPLNKNLIMFPSYLKHSIRPNKSQKTRYSIACNFHPIGDYGAGDSRISGLNYDHA